MIVGTVVEENVSVLVVVEATVTVVGVDDVAFVKSCASETVVALLAIEIPVELVAIGWVEVLVDVVVLLVVVELVDSDSIFVTAVIVTPKRFESDEASTGSLSPTV